MVHLVAFYVAIAILVLFLGTKQEKNLDKACIAAMSLVGLSMETTLCLILSVNLKTSQVPY